MRRIERHHRRELRRTKKLRNAFLFLIIIIGILVYFNTDIKEYYASNYKDKSSEKTDFITSIDSFIDEFYAPNKEREQNAFNHINAIRKSNNLHPLQWDDKLYELAIFKLKDLDDRNYFDHPDPDGRCVGSYAYTFGLPNDPGSYADNLGQGYGNSFAAINGWMESRGHKFNLLHHHATGAVATGYGHSVFIGYAPHGNWICDTGAAGLAFWS